MAKVVVTEKALREVLREVMWNKEFSGWSSNSGGPATVNSNVDPSIAVTDPVNPNFKPQSKTEFGVAVNQLVKSLPDDQMPGLFDVVKSAVEDEKEKEDEEQMSTKAAQGGSKQVEEAFRKVIRDIIKDVIKEAGDDPQKKDQAPPPLRPPGHTDAETGEYVPVNRPKLAKNAKPGKVVGDLPPVRRFPTGMSGGEAQARHDKSVSKLRSGMGKAIADYENPKVAPEDEPEAPVGGRGHAYKNTALGGMTDVQGATFEQIADELGFSVAGAKQAVDKALRKARWLADYAETTASGEEDDLDIMILSSVADYIEKLEKSPDLKTPEKLKELGRNLYVALLESSGDLSPGDVQLMQRHPDIVEDLDGFKSFWTKFQKDPIGHIKGNLEVATDAIAGLDDFREFLAPIIKGMRKSNPIEDSEDVTPTAAPAAPAVAAPTSARAPNLPDDTEPGAAPAPAAAAPAAAKAGGKSSYKIYPGAAKYAAPGQAKPPAVTRVGGKVYRSGADTQFAPGEQGVVSMDGDKLKVKKSDSDHTQTWDPVEEAKRPVLFLNKPDGR